MNAKIVGADESSIGVTVFDNADVEHQIEMRLDGEIYSHHQDGYPDDPSNRTNEANEHVEQARRYAKYTVFRARGHPTVDPRTVPEWVAVVAMTVARLSPEAFQTQFGGYYRQFRSTVEADVEPVVTVPDSAVDGLRSFRQHVHLSLSLADAFEESQATALRDALRADGDPETVAANVATHLDSTVVDPDAITVTATSDIGVLYQGRTDETVIDIDDPVSDPPDARLELAPMNLPWEAYLPPEGFQFLVSYHLLCQVRDCYLRLGLEPPAGVRLLGMGTYRQTVRNEHLDMYEPVHYTDATIPGYSLPDSRPA